MSKTTVEDAVSVAGMLLTTEVAVTKDFTYTGKQTNNKTVFSSKDLSLKNRNFRIKYKT